MKESWKGKVLRWKFNLFPAYRRTGGRVQFIAEDFSEMRVRLPLNWRTRNYVGTIYGGSMFGATDPIYMLMLINTLGKAYVAWDKAASIKFVRPGTSTLYAHFVLTPEYIATVKSEVMAAGEKDCLLDVELKNAEGQVIAVVQRTLYVATKAHYKQKQLKKKAQHG
ncbi:MAG: DUF4442 domain-containing protein [Cyclobacteriaceae bacterium]